MDILIKTINGVQYNIFTLLYPKAVSNNIDTDILMEKWNNFVMLDKHCACEFEDLYIDITKPIITAIDIVNAINKNVKIVDFIGDDVVLFENNVKLIIGLSHNAEYYFSYDNKSFSKTSFLKKMPKLNMKLIERSL